MKSFILLLFVTVLLGACGQDSTKATLPKIAVETSPQCSGKKAGYTFPSSDGCNSCYCDASGRASCTLMGCSAQ